MRLIAKSFGLALLGSLLLMVAVPIVFAAQADNIDVPFALTTGEFCSGDTVNIQGTDHLVLQVTQSSDGGFHYLLHTNVQDGTSYDVQTGETCILQDINQGFDINQPNQGYVFNSAPGAATVFTMQASVRFVCPGPSNNEVLHYLLHLTTDANGNATATVFDSKVTCGQ
jgi:hypothetical protein